MGTLFGVAVVIAVVCVCVAAERHKQTAFRDRFPPISDAEFLARCRPGTDPVVALRVRQTVAESMGVEYGRIYPSSRLIKDLDAA
jgi:hypothetical protein